MSDIIHARVEGEVLELLERLRRRLGTSDSDIVRRGIRALAEVELSGAPRKIIGVGAFESDTDDLGSNDEHLAGFGK